MSAAPSTPPKLAQLRPDPLPVTPYGPYRADGPGKLIKFPTKGYRVIAWIERHCVLTAQQYLGKPFKLEPWQKQLILDLFEQGRYRNVDITGFVREVWRRRYRWALLGLPRKSGKTELLAALALYFLLGEENAVAPVIVMAASSEKQAGMLFGAASRMAKYSKTLSKRVDRLADEIQVIGRPEAKILRVSANPSTTLGLNITVLIADELLAWPPGDGDDLWDSLTTAMSIAEEPLVVAITTAGTDIDNTLCGREYQYGRRVESGEIKNPHYLFRWWQAPDGCDYKDPEMWRRANPAYGRFKQPAYFKDRILKTRESKFRQLELNQWTKSEHTFLPAGVWESNFEAVVLTDEAAELLALVRAKAEREPDNYESQVDLDIVETAINAGLQPGLRTFIGWDASRVSDSTAVVAAQSQLIESRTRIRLRAWVWERPIDPTTRREVDDWTMPLNREQLETSSTDTVVKAEHAVVDVLWSLNRWFNVAAVGYDPQFVAWEAEKLNDAGMPMVTIQQGVRMAQGTEALFEAAMSKRLAHDEDPVLARHISHAIVVAQARGSGVRRIQKGASKRKMDAAVALVMALWTLLNPPAEEEKFDPRDMLYTGR